MSRYDRLDPGLDSEYCDGLRAEGDSASPPHSIYRGPQAALGIDPISHAAQTIHAAAGDLLTIATKHTSSLDARRMYDLARALRDRLDAVIALTGEQMDTLPLHPF